MNDQKKKKALRLIIVVLIVAAIGLVYVAVQRERFNVTSVEPASGQATVWAPYFKINFNHTLVSSNLSATVAPNVVYKNQISVSGSTLTINLNVPLNANQTYTITVNKIFDTKGQEITNKVFHLVPKNGSLSQLTDDQQESLVTRDEQSSVYKDPVLSHLPYNGVDFNLSASFPIDSHDQPHLILNAQLFLHAAQTGNESSGVAQDEQEVQTFIQSLGLNPSNYTIQYQVATP